MPGAYGKGGLSCAEEVQLMEHGQQMVDAEAQVVAVALPLVLAEEPPSLVGEQKLHLTPTLQRLRWVCTVVLVTVVLCFGLATQMGSEVEWMWSLSVTGIDGQEHQRAAVGAGVVWPEDQRPGVVRADGLDDDDAGGHRRWDKRGAFAVTDDDGDGDYSVSGWRRQHARTAYLRTLL